MSSPTVIPERPVVEQALRKLRHPRLGFLVRERLVLKAQRRFHPCEFAARYSKSLATDRVFKTHAGNKRAHQVAVHGVGGSP